MVEGDPGMMGGAVSHEYMAYAEAGEDEIVFCRECGYAANVELAVAGADREPPLSETAPRREAHQSPGLRRARSTCRSSAALDTAGARPSPRSAT